MLKQNKNCLSARILALDPNTVEDPLITDMPTVPISSLAAQV